MFSVWLDVNSGTGAHELGEPQTMHFASFVQGPGAIRPNGEVFVPWPAHVLESGFDSIRSSVK